MLVTDFDYELPQELIAQHPMEPRDHSRLLVVDKHTGEIQHKHFYDLVDYLRPGDVLVFNDTRVIPAHEGYGCARRGFSADAQRCDGLGGARASRQEAAGGRKD